MNMPLTPPARVTPTLSRFLPLIDPDCFSDVAFFSELSAIGYRQVLLGGTGSEAVADTARAVRAQTELEVILYPAGPSGVCDADLVILPDVMNSGAAHARPFGPGAVATALATAALGCPFLPVAYFIQGDSTARHYYDAHPICRARVVDHCRYAQMVGYRHIALDYEGPGDIDAALTAQIKARAPGCWLTVSDEVCPAAARALIENGVDTLVLPSDILEEASDPLALAERYYAELLA